MTSRLAERDRCTSRYERAAGIVVRCSKRKDHAGLHSNETAGHEAQWPSGAAVIPNAPNA